MRVRVLLRCRSDLYIMTKAPENAPSLLFLGDNEKNGGADSVTTNDTNFMITQIPVQRW